MSGVWIVLVLTAVGAGFSLVSLPAALLGVVVLTPCDLPLAVGDLTIYTNEAYLAGIGAGLAWTWARQPQKLRGGWEALWPLLPFLAVLAVSIVAASDRSAGIKQWLRWAEFALVFLLPVVALREPAQFARVLNGLLIMAMAAGLLGVFQHFLGPRWPGDLELAARGADLMSGIHTTRAHATFGHPNQFAGYLVLVLPLALGRFLEQGRWRGACGYSAVVAVLGSALALTYSRGAWLGTAAALALVLAYAFRRRPRQAALVLLSLVLAAGAVFAASPNLRQRAGSLVHPRADSASTGRIGYQRLAFQIVRERPWFGHGGGNYSRVIGDYQARGLADRTYLSSHIHNLYAQIAIETGALGAAAFLFFLSVWVRRVLRGLRALPAAADRALLLSLLAGAVAFLIHNLFDVLIIYGRGIHFALILGLGLAFISLNERPGLAPTPQNHQNDGSGVRGR